MTSLPKNLYINCQTVLAQCSEFDSLNSLRSVFGIAELNPFRNALPDAESRQDRVNKTIDYLTSQTASKATESLLSIFLDMLISRRSEIDKLREDLRNLKQDITSWLTNYADIEIEIPIVCFAMTRREVEEVINGEVFSDPGVAPLARDEFLTLCTLLKKYGITDLHMLYGERREDWKIEYPKSDNTVENVIISTMNCINDTYRKESIPIRPRFESTNFFDPSTKMETWSRLSEYGCIVIVDVVSLFHPLLSEVLLQSGIVHNDNDPVAIFIHNPVNSQSFSINSTIEQYINKKVQRAFHRFDKKLDKLCEFGLGGVRTLQRWLNAVVPDVEKFVTGEHPREVNRQSVRKTSDNPPRRVEELFLNRRT